MQENPTEAIIRAAIRDELATVVEQLRLSVSNDIKCSIHKCPLSEETLGETTHFFGMIKDIGSGNLNGGVEEVRKNHSFVKRVRDKSDKFSTYVFMIFLASISGGVLKALWDGFKKMASQ